MGVTTAELTTREVIERTRATAHQLHRWSDAGLLPHPDVRGRGFGQGRDGIWPASVVPQVTAIRKLVAEDRSLSRVALALWWQGYGVDSALVRTALEESFAWWERIIGPLILASDQLTNRAFDLIERAATARYKSRWLRQVRKRVGSGAFEVFMSLMVRITTGQSLVERGLSDDSTILLWGEDGDLQTVEKGFGLSQKNELPWHGMALMEAMNAVAERLALRTLRKTAAAATDDDLTAARHELRTMLQLLADMRHMQSVIQRARARRRPYTTGVGQWPALNLLSHYLPALLLGWLSVRGHPRARAGLPTVMEVASQVSAVRRKGSAIQRHA
jgi:hypothetical protein